MFSVKMQAKGDTLRQLREIAGSDKKFKRNMATAINRTQNKAQSLVAKKIYAELNTTQAAIKERIVKGPKATDSKLSTTVVVDAEGKGNEKGRLPLARFKPRQNKSGVSYKISRTRGRKTIPGAFMGPKPGQQNSQWKGNVFKRVGKSRLPIVKLMGVSPWGVYVKKKYDRPVRKEIQAELRKQINERLRFLRLKKSGAI